jgi:integrase/recombinase XerD
MKTLREAAQEYLRMRRGLGFKLRHDERRLKRFVAFMEQQNASHITSELALKWAMQPAGAQPATWGGRLTSVRGFARYCSGADPRTEIPPVGLVPYRPRRATPYLYSEQEIRAAHGGSQSTAAEWWPAWINLLLLVWSANRDRSAHQRGAGAHP